MKNPLEQGKKSQQEAKKQTRQTIIKVITTLAAIVTFITTTLITEQTFEKWKGKVENLFSFKENNFELDSPFVFRRLTKNKELALKVELPIFKGKHEETDSIYKAISYHLVDFLSTDSAFNIIDSLQPPINYAQLKETLYNYFPSKKYNKRSIKFTFIKDSVRPVDNTHDGLQGYLYLSMLESSDTTYSDTLKLEYLNFDRVKMQPIEFKSTVTPFFINYAETLYRDTIKTVKRTKFYNDFFFLPPAFYLDDHAIHFQYFREKNTQAFQGSDRKYELTVPLESIDKLFINPEGKLSYLIKSQH